ncbi:helix-turn-helix domain-containing protein [Haloferacaceae archaeon DSL9]
MVKITDMETELARLVVGLVAIAHAVVEAGGRVAFGSAVSLFCTQSVALSRPGGLVAVVGYSRYRASPPLEHPERRLLYDRIRSTPGVYLSALAARSEHSLSSVRHHVGVLEDAEYVVSKMVRGKRRYYPADTADHALLAALADDAVAAVLFALAGRDGRTVSGVADDLDKDPSTISHHLTRLAEDGVVEQQRCGRQTLSRLAPRSEVRLARMLSSTIDDPDGDR